MAGLVLKMAPKERVLINGAVIENCERRSRFSIITPDAHVLRLKDAIHPDDARTPMGHVCYQLQMVLTGNAAPEMIAEQLIAQIVELAKILQDPFSQSQLGTAFSAIKDGKFYNALKAVKPLLPLEKALLDRPLRSA